MSIQGFGESFNLEKFYHAREVARDMTHELAYKIKPGMREEEAHELYRLICKDHRIEKNWHPPKIRFGPNTLKSFKEVSDPYELHEEDIFYIDIGPVIDGHEADYGETFTLGQNYELKRMADASVKIFNLVRDHWIRENFSGPQLYQYAKKVSEDLGYHLNMGSDGHRIADFPHHVFFKGAIIECEESLVPNAWILEIQLDHPKLRCGAFFEDILK
jgi:Xaa-Pro aminopeptidase